MIARIAVTFNFEAAHWSPEWPEHHQNSRMHGHSYVAELIAEGEIKWERAALQTEALV